VNETFLIQAVALYWALICFFRMGAMTKGLSMGRTRWLEIAQAAAMGVLLFWLLTDGRGLRNYPQDPLLDELVAIHPIKERLRHHQRGAHLATSYAADRGLGNATLTRDLRMHALVSSKAGNQDIV
jgi:hypothetical protein